MTDALHDVPGGSVHVYPIDDLIQHELSVECACGPRAEPELLPSGVTDYFYVHNSLDGREESERAIGAHYLREAAEVARDHGTARWDSVALFLEKRASQLDPKRET